MKIATYCSKALAALLVLLMLSPAFSQRIEFSYPDAWGNSGFNLTRQDNSGVRVIHSIPQLALFDFNVNGTPMKMVEVDGAFLPNNEGAPNLPGNGRYIAIPQGSTPVLKINAVRKEIVNNVDFVPAPNIPYANDDSPLKYVKDMSIYNQNAFYPAEPFQISEPTTLRGVDVVMLGITPFQYNPVTKQLIIYHDIDVEVEFQGGNGYFGEDRLRSRWWDPILEDAILNSNALPKIDYSARQRELMNSRPEGAEYLIIIPNDPVFLSWADSIRIFRQKQGIITKIVTTAQIGANNALQIKNYIANAYNTWQIPPAAFLIIGDHGTTGNTVVSGPVPSSSAISDNYYATITGNDDLPEIAIARITARHAADLQIMIPKFLNYERNPPTNPNFYNVPITAMGWQTERWFQICSESVNGFWQYQLGKQPLRQNNIYSGTVGTTWSTATNTATVVNVFGPNGLNYIPATPAHLNGFGWNANSASINQAINNGAFAMMHRDHGSETGWGEPNYNISHFSGLNNNDLVFVFSINCLTGKYNISGECFAEAFHRHQKGALGIIAASEISYSFVNDTYVWGMMDNMWPNFMPQYGTTPAARGVLPAFGNTAGKIFLAQSNWPYNTSNKQITYYLFHHHGDAFSTVYSEMPQQLTVNHMPVLLSGLDMFEVTANPGALIALTVNGEIIGVGTGTGMPVAIPIPPQIPGNVMLVTITLQNYYRYEAELEIIPPAGPYVIYNQSVINDSQGNNNGIIDFGESIILDVALKNVGLDPANGVVATLATSSGYVTITDNTHAYGNILPDQVVMMPGAFAFNVSNQIPNNTIIPFEITMVSGNNTWVSNFSLMAYAPAIAIGNLSISDPTGNNNGQADPGETVNLIIPTLNSGQSQATNLAGILTCSSPYITINTGQVSFASLNPGQSANAVFTITVDAATPIGTPIPLTYTVNSGVYGATKDFVIKVGLIIEDFETGDFSSYAWTFAGNQPWTITNVNPYEGLYSAKSGVITHNQSSQLKLDYDVGSNDSISFYCKVSSESNYDYLKFFVNNQMLAQWSGTVPWQRVAFPVTAGFKTFRWEYMKDGSVSTGEDCAWIDFITLPTPALCPSPVALQALSTTASTAMISWMPGGNETVYDLLWGPAGFNPATSGTLVQGINAVPFELTGLSAVTQYDFYVRGYCDNNILSAWSGPATFATLCDTFTLPFNETFSTPSVTCWSYPQGQGNWIVGTSYTPPSSQSGAPNAAFNWSPSLTNYSFSLTSPLFDATGFTEVKMNYILFINSYSNSTVENMAVEFKTNASTDWTLLELFTTTGLGSGNAEYIKVNQVLAGMAGNLFQVRFRAHGPNSFNINGWGLDDILIHGSSQPPVTPGDANCDGMVNVLDVITSVNYVTGGNPQPFCFQNADVNGDGTVNVLDVIATVNIVTGGTKSSPFEIDSETAHIYLNRNGIELQSDGTLAGLQFELSGLDPANMNFLADGFEFVSSMHGDKLTGMIFSFDNTPIPAGRINLFSFNSEVTSMQWGKVVAGNLNADEVKVLRHIEGRNLMAEEMKLNAFPNPSLGQFNIELALPCISETLIRVTDMMGREVVRVFEGSLAEGKHRFELNSNQHLQSGVYFLHVQASPVVGSEDVIIRQIKLIVTE